MPPKRTAVKRERQDDEPAVAAAQSPLGSLMEKNKDRALYAFYEAITMGNSDTHRQLAMSVVDDGRCGIEGEGTNSASLLIKCGEVSFTGVLTPFLIAAASGRLDLMIDLEKKGANINVGTGRNNYTALHAAILQSPNTSMLKFLIEKKINLNPMEKSGRTTVMFAAFYGCTEALKILLDNKLDVSASTMPAMMTALHFATTNGHVSAMAELIAAGAPLEAVNKNGDTPLSLAVRTATHANHIGNRSRRGRSVRANNPVLELLITKGANLKYRTPSNNNSLLHIAADGDFLMEAKLLLAHGADKEALDSKGNTPLHSALSGYWCTVALLLIEKGANVNAVNNKENSALCLATSRDRAFNHGDTLVLIDALVKKGANVNYTGSNGRTLLHKAMMNSDRDDENGFDKISALLKLGANIHSVDKKGETPLALLIGRSYLNIELAKFLVRLGADINTKNKDGRTLLHALAVEGYSFEMRKLIEMGADVDATRKDGSTPFHDASKGYVGWALAENGADINAKNRHGQTPLHCAAIYKTACISVLVHEGADLRIKCKKKLTPLDAFEQSDPMGLPDDTLEFVRAELTPS